MRVLLISENRCRENLTPYPLGPAHVASALKLAGHEVRGLDLMFSGDPARDVEEALAFDPEVIGISVRNIDNQDSRHPVLYLEETRRVVAEVRARTGAPVVLGGAGFTIFPLECLEYLDVEMGVVGEGELAFPAMLERISSGGEVLDVPGAAVRRGCAARVNRPVSRPDAAGLPAADHETFDPGPYDWVPPGSPFLANVQSRRGCHMECIYCPNPLIEGRAIRCREIGSVIDELRDLRSRGVGTVIFTDSMFNRPPGYAFEMCAALESRCAGIRWMCSLNPFGPDERLIEAMRRAGCSYASIGNESGSQGILDLLRKGFSREDIVKTVEGAKRAGIRVNLFLLLGGPGETRSTVEESVEFVRGLEPAMVTVTPGIRIYPGCELAGIALEEGVIKAGQDLLKPTFYTAPDVEPWLYDYCRELCDRMPGWVM